MPISKKLAKTISTISLFGMPLGFYGSCAYIDLQAGNLDITSPTCDKDRDHLRSANNMLPPALFGLFLTGYAAGITAYHRREDEEEELRRESYRAYNVMDERAKSNFRGRILKSHGEEGLEYFLEAVKKSEKDHF